MEKKILCLDDDGWVRQSYRRTFSFAEVVLGANGVEGLDLYGQNSEIYGLIITDNHMPRMSGLEFLERIKELENPPPRLMYSSPVEMSDQRLHEVVKELGGLGLIIKPIEPDVFRIIGQELLARGTSPTLEHYFAARYQ